MNLYFMSEAQGVRPSEFLGISRNRWVSYQFDRAVFLYGRQVMNCYDETYPSDYHIRSKRGKRKHRLEECMGLEPMTDQFGRPIASPVSDEPAVSGFIEAARRGQLLNVDYDFVPSQKHEA